VYRQNHRATLRAAEQRWRAANPEKVREYNRRYKARNREKVLELYRRANARRRNRPQASTGNITNEQSV
jgi:hypothetical protein